MLLCRVMEVACAIEAAHVVEILRPLPLRPLHGMPFFVVGLAVLRGVPTPIVDARRLLGAQQPAPAERWVSLRIEGRRVGLAVDAVVGLQELPSHGALPPLLRDASASAIAALSSLDTELLLVLQGARLLPPVSSAPAVAETP